MYKLFSKDILVPRPGGNPKIKDHGFKTDRPESLTAHLSMRVTPSMLRKLRTHDNWREFVRNAITRAFKEDQEKQGLKSAQDTN